MTIGFDRRQCLAAATGALWSTLIVNHRLAAAVAQALAAATAPPAPVARVAIVHDTYFGETLSDPYRWMENDKDPEWLPFLKGQNDHTRALLDALPTRSGLLKRIQQLSGDTVSTSQVQRAGGMTFFLQRPLGADNFKLFFRQGMDGPDRVLVDPTTHSTAQSHLSLDWWRASPDGRYVVYGLSKNGSEDSTLRIWLSDVRPEARAYIAPLGDIIANRAQWTRIADFADEVTDVEIDGDHLYVLANAVTPRGRLLKTSAASPSLITAQVVVPQGPSENHGRRHQPATTPRA